MKETCSGSLHLHLHRVSSKLATELTSPTSLHSVGATVQPTISFQVLELPTDLGNLATAKQEIAVEPKAVSLAYKLIRVSLIRIPGVIWPCFLPSKLHSHLGTPSNSQSIPSDLRRKPARDTNVDRGRFSASTLTPLASWYHKTRKKTQWVVVAGTTNAWSHWASEYQKSQDKFTLGDPESSYENNSRSSIGAPAGKRRIP